MNRIQSLFNKKNKNVLSVYFTAGHPTKESPKTIIEELQKSGADLIEIGIPFSDPLADGKTIQESSSIALENGMSLDLLFNQLASIREKVTIPLILMGYFNPVLQYGIDAFCKKCKEVGIDGLIIPDLPIWEYSKNYKKYFIENGIENIFLISPQTPDDRIKLIDNETNSFIYIVSSAATTGAQTGISQEQKDYFTRINNLKLRNPKLIGFGISNNETYTTACEYANGVIIGSAFINALTNATDLPSSINNFISNIRG